jgi:hypothetical protein
MAFHILSPQWVRHDSGYAVSVQDRETVSYIDQSTRAVIGVDFGQVVLVYGGSLRYIAPGPERTSKEVVVTRILDGLRAMGSSVELA